MTLIDALRERSRGRYWDSLAFEQLESEGGRGVCRVRIDERHLNYNDIAHGGVVAGLVDSAAGLAARSLRTTAEIAARPHATSDLHVQYLAAARGTLTATGRVVRAGRTALFAEVEVRDDADRLIARGSVTFIIAAPREPDGPA